MCLGYGIVAPGTSRMTPEYSLNSKNTTFQGSVFLDRFDTIFRARGDISAFCGSHQRGNACPVKLDQKYQYVLHLSNPVFLHAARRESSTCWHLQSKIVCLAMSRKSYPTGNSASVLRKASFIKRLARLRQTLFPTFLLAKKAFRL